MIRKMFFVVGFLWSPLVAAEWPEFRGPNAQGVVEAKEVPSKMGKENLVWKTALPGAGWSSPVMSDGLIVVTTAVKANKLELRTMALNAETGKVVWDQKIFEPSEEEVGDIHSKNSLASSTPLIVGDVVFAHFGHMGTAALSLKTGEVKWRFHKTYPSMHGNGGCPVLVDGVLIFSADGIKKGLLRGLDAKTGKLKWEIDRKQDVKQKFSFGTPLVVKVDGKKMVVSQGSGMVGGYRPSDGKLLWWVDYGKGFSVVPRPVYHDGRVYVATGFMKAKLLSIRLAGAKDEVTDSHVEWAATKDIPTTPSFVLSGDEIYVTDDTGRLSCLDRKTGERLWRDGYKRKISASLTLVGNRLFAFSEEGQGFVHEVSREGAKEVVVNEFEEPVFASPIAFDGAMIVRSKSALWRFGK
ncbi:PQQ-like beta-propeller repeat protein [Akkermansiaceae bacterium]|nr:PQQ-like beta-propeller repeat protein [Akkermansiaceae bacterium]